jgi:hypothetical protein
MLLGSTLLEVAIGVFFVYLLVSLLCSALNELIEALLKYRASYLRRGIEQLLNDPDLATQFFEHPLIKPLGKKPSYIPARTFSLALWNIATEEANQAAGGKEGAAGLVQNVDAIRALLAGLTNPKLKDLRVSLLSLIDEAESSVQNKALVLDAARKNVEAWYDDAMDRVSGWYKRRVHFVLIILGLLASFALNIDTIQITKTLLYNDTLRKAVADAAEDYVKTHPAPTPAPTATPTATPSATPTTTPTPGSTANAGTTDTPGTTNTTPTPSPSPTPAPEVTAQEQARLARAKINQVRDELNDLGLPIGWPTEPPPVPAITEDPYTGMPDAEKRAARRAADEARYTANMSAYNTDPRWPSPGKYGWFLKILGLILTGLAVSQGAPFWFDLLNKFIVIRSTVKPQEKSRTQPSKDKPAPETEEKKTNGNN